MSERRREAARRVGRANRRHGGNGTPEYRAWINMKERCLNPRSKSYPLYGGRGITICERWVTSEAFIADMGPRPEGMSLDRIDNDGPYTPENCRWATPTQQQRNQRRTRFVQWEGRRRPLQELAEQFGLNADTIDQRLKLGWSIEDALTKPVAA